MARCFSPAPVTGCCVCTLFQTSHCYSHCYRPANSTSLCWLMAAGSLHSNTGRMESCLGQILSRVCNTAHTDSVHTAHLLHRQQIIIPLVCLLCCRPNAYQHVSTRKDITYNHMLLCAYPLLQTWTDRATPAEGACACCQPCSRACAPLQPQARAGRQQRGWQQRGWQQRG